jgi:1,4-dihydroxy-2-naphthoate polyprenyltransferase
MPESGAQPVRMLRSRGSGRCTIVDMATSAATSTSSPGAISAWFLAARPKTLPAAVAPVLVGCAVAASEGAFALAPALAAFLVAILLQIGANFANDVADFRKGADTQARLGPTRVTQSGLLTARQVTIATAVTLGLAAIPGLYLVSLGGPALAALGLLAIAAAVLYTAGPKPFGYLGLGELFVFLFFGPVAVVGTAYVMIGTVSTLAVAASVPIGCLITAILVVNNLRDVGTDRASGKRTLAVRIGVEATRWEYTLLLGTAYLAPLFLWLSGLTSPGPILAWATLPMATVLTKRIWKVDGRALNPVLGGTARLSLWFAIALAAGILW